MILRLTLEVYVIEAGGDAGIDVHTAELSVDEVVLADFDRAVAIDYFDICHMAERT